MALEEACRNLKLIEEEAEIIHYVEDVLESIGIRLHYAYWENSLP